MIRQVNLLNGVRVIVSPYIRFKTERQQNEWSGDLLHPALIVIVQAAALYHFREYGAPAVITHLLRTREEQRKIYLDKPNQRSVHEFGRGCDLRTTHISNIFDKWADWLNLAFRYHGAPSCHTALVHNIGHGHHLHIQVGPDERRPDDQINLVA